MRILHGRTLAIALAGIFIMLSLGGYAQKDPKQKKSKTPTSETSEPKRYKVEGGILKEVKLERLSDTVVREVVVTDSVKNIVDSTSLLSSREQRRLRKALLDSTTVRHSAIFRDSMPLPRLCLISMGVPGFGQLYNQQYWKIPLVYATLGSTLYFAINQNKQYKSIKSEYDNLIKYGASREQIDPVQTSMIRRNTVRELFMAGFVASYIYFIGDAAVNYQGYASSVKKATTLSTICPGAGQIYNRSYWKVPIVLGGFATMAYMIDFNNRGYKRFKLAYELSSDGDDSTMDEFNGRYSPDFLRNYRNNYRRNRDLCIILTGAFYLLNIIDAHVDAQLKDYDISDDLAVTVQPSISNFYSMRRGPSNLMGLSVQIRF